MTDQTIPAGLTRDQAQTVREWAERARGAEIQDETVAHAARVLLAVLPTPPTAAKENPELPDQTLDDQMRPIVAAMRAAMRRDEHAYPEAKFLADLSGYIKDLEALLPKRPTLADMTLDEQAECTGMQADLAQGDRVVILDGTPDSDGLVQVLETNLDVYRPAPAEVTPRPDLPRLEWPSEQGAEDVTPPKVGDVIESADDPRLDALPVGTVLVDCDGETVAKRSEAWAGLGYIPIESEGDEFGPWTVRRIGWEADQ